MPATKRSHRILTCTRRLGTLRTSPSQSIGSSAYDVHIAQAKAVTSLDAARALLEHAFESAIATLGTITDAELDEPIPNDIVMGGAPKRAVISGIVDHTAHHRGSLAVYARLRGKVPHMPYE